MCQSTDKEQYLLLSKLQSFKRKVDRATDICKTALANSNNASLSFSGGKDSVVMLDIAYNAGFRGDLMFFKYGLCTDMDTPQENIDMLLNSAARYGLTYTVVDCMSEVDCWDMCGRFFIKPETPEEKRIYNLTIYDFVKKSQEYEARNNIDLNFIGMCKDESRIRQITLSKKGAIYKTKSRQATTCCPLIYFTAKDVWAYIFSRNLPYLSIYDYAYIDRCKNRNEITIMYNDAIIENGMMWHYKQMYPDYFMWLEERWGYRL